MLFCFPRMKILGLVSPQSCLLVRLISCHLFAPGNLKSGTPNFWKMEGAQKVTFSIQNLYSQMHFRSQMCPGGHLEGFEACLKHRSELRTRERNSFALKKENHRFARQSLKIMLFSKEYQTFERSSWKNHRFPKRRWNISTMHLRNSVVFIEYPRCVCVPPGH